MLCSHVGQLATGYQPADRFHACRVLWGSVHAWQHDWRSSLAAWSSTLPNGLCYLGQIQPGKSFVHQLPNPLPPKKDQHLLIKLRNQKHGASHVAGQRSRTSPLVHGYHQSWHVFQDVPKGAQSHQNWSPHLRARCIALVVQPDFPDFPDSSAHQILTIPPPPAKTEAWRTRGTSFSGNPDP